jgi:hypothetical protein
MANSLCEFSLITPSWLGTVTTVVGLVLAIIGFCFLAKGTKVQADDKITLKLSVFEFSTGVVGSTIFLGIILLLLGIVVISATRHEPFARWIGGIVTSLVDKKDPAVSGDFNDESMAGIESNLGQDGLYVVRLTDAAKREKITGTYTNQRCYAELLSQICRQQSQRLTCSVDADKKVIKVCKLPTDAECAGK